MMPDFFLEPVTTQPIDPLPYVRGREYQTDSWDMFAVVSLLRFAFTFYVFFVCVGDGVENRSSSLSLSCQNWIMKILDYIVCVPGVVASGWCMVVVRTLLVEG